MKRMHLGMKVDSLAPSLEFYTRLFGVAPTLQRTDYAKWMLDDPYLNFSLLERPGQPGLHHFGFQLESEAELHAARRQLANNGFETVDENHLACGYQLQSKSWVFDPQGVAVEHFFTHGQTPDFGVRTEDSEAIHVLRSKALAKPNSTTVSIRRCAAADWMQVVALLAENDLPCEDLLTEMHRDFFVAVHDASVVGAVGLQPCASDALLRSLVVKDDFRGTGIGAKLTDAIENHASLCGIRTLYLLTMTAGEFFQHRNYQTCDRTSVPTPVSQTREFSNLCPDTAVCLFKSLRGTTMTQANCG